MKIECHIDIDIQSNIGNINIKISHSNYNHYLIASISIRITQTRPVLVWSMEVIKITMNILSMLTVSMIRNLNLKLQESAAHSFLRAERFHSLAAKLKFWRQPSIRAML